MISLLLALTAQDPATAGPPEPAIPVVEAAAPAAPPVAIRREPLVSFSELGDAAGHTGRAVVEATLHPDGKIERLEVVQSSRSELLDADALSTVAEARYNRLPAEPTRLRLTVEFRPTEALTMKCDEFARQVRWYETAWPERTMKDTIIYVMSLGFTVLTDPQGDGLRAAMGRVGEFESAFRATLTDCEARPDHLYMQTLNRRLGRSR